MNDREASVDIEALFQPLRFGPMMLPNRIVVAPLTTCRERDGRITADSHSFWAEMARGGAGLVVLGDVAVHEPIWVTPSLAEDRYIEGLATLAESVHEVGARLGIQLYHRGCDIDRVREHRQRQGITGLHSKILEASEGYGNGLARDELLRIVQDFAAASRRAAEAGVDVIQIHGDHLLGQLASETLNERDDEFGGSLEGRLRMSLEVVTAIRRAALPVAIDFKLPIIADDLGSVRPRGLRLEEALRASSMLRDAGVDGLHVAAACDHASRDGAFPRSVVEGSFAAEAAAVRATANIPVTTVGNIQTAEGAAGLLNSGAADLVALGRALIADPNWPRKVRARRFDEIETCRACHRGCVGRLLAGRPIECDVSGRWPKTESKGS